MIVVAVVGVVWAAFSGCGANRQPADDAAPAEPTVAVRPLGQTPARQETAQPTPNRPSFGSARAALEKLPVKGRAPKAGYSREQFGEGWATVAGCDTRNRILRRDLRRKTYEPGDTCAVQSGRLDDPYTAAAIEFVRGASEVDVDHVVALGDAWQKGAQQWTAARRVRFANDPLNLLSVDAAANRQKGDGDAATWLPPNKAFRCEYAARQVAVKRRYHAWVTRAEHDAIERVLGRCPGERLPSARSVRVPASPARRAGRRRATPTPASPSSPSRRGRVFANCDAVRAAGLDPLRRGTAAYSANSRLDRDRDGLACE